MLAGPGEDTPERTASFIGIVVAISGNIIISLALNCQKLAHKRIEQAHRDQRLRPSASGNALSPSSSSNKFPPSARSKRTSQYGSPRKQPRDTTPLKPIHSTLAKYGAAVSSRFKLAKRAETSRKSSGTSTYDLLDSPYEDGAIDDEGEDDPVTPRPSMSRGNGNFSTRSSASNGNSHFEAEGEENDELGDLVHDEQRKLREDEAYPEESSYLRSKLW